LVCDRTELHTAFQTVSPAAGQRSPKPILQNVKVIAADGVVTILATDLEVGVRYTVPGVEVKKPGEAVVPATHISAILRELEDEKVQVQVDKNHCEVSGQHSRFKVLGQPPDEFPDVPGFPESPHLSIPGHQLVRMIHRTLFATDTENTRYALGGVLWQLSPKEVVLVATDGRRLAVMGHKTKVSDEAPKTGIVPPKALALVERTMAKDDENVDVVLHAGDILLRTGHAVIYSRLLEGKYPKYQDVIPKTGHQKATVPAGALASALRQAAIITSEDSRGVIFTFKDNRLTLASKAAEVGESTVEIPIDFAGDGVAITFNPQYLLQPLREVASNENVLLEMSDSETAATLKTDDGYMYVLMPLTGGE